MLLAVWAAVFVSALYIGSQQLLSWSLAAILSLHAVAKLYSGMTALVDPKAPSVSKGSYEASTYTLHPEPYNISYLLPPLTAQVL